ncbi:MAG TPA: UDP-N-acetylmuramoyl-tripeptide--D-alanyl-D-alanine ligase [Luteibaculaceae bacterium]|nr:UDP-N-acetylmuramoyl-tripeptide--D-alanyl-D-alanine ligase [Luteibaculaceae bacterium]
MNIQQLYRFFQESNGVSTDTRTLKKGQLYFALKGPNFNGNQLALTALEQGAHKVIVDEAIGVKDPRIIEVADVLSALQQLARYHRDQLDTVVIGITGTNGKTTSKELIFQVLSSQYPTLATQGNLNNHIGVPLTLLSITEDHDFAVIEMGANHKGEIAELCKISDPDFGLVTNVGRAHLEGFGSFENIIYTKKGLYEHVADKNGVLFMNRNNAEVLGIPAYDRVIYFGTGDEDFCQGKMLASAPFVQAEVTTVEGTTRISSQLVGGYNFDNIMAAVCIGSYFEVPLQKIARAIADYTPSNNRSQYKKTVLNDLYLDAYNANPSSMELSVGNFARLEVSPKHLILGDMFELGHESQHYHSALVEQVKETGIPCYFVGEHFMQVAEGSDRFFPDTQSLIAHLKTHPIEHHHILIKGSRGVRLETVAEIL